MSFLLPELMNNYIPAEMYCDTYHQLFNSILNEILANQTIQEENTLHFVVESMINFAVNEDHYRLLVKWLDTNTISTTRG